jgi:hypothetical protein
MQVVQHCKKVQTKYSCAGASPCNYFFSRLCKYKATNVLKFARWRHGEGQRRENRGDGGAEGWGLWRGLPLTNQVGGLGSVVSSSSGVQGGVPADNNFRYVLSLKKGVGGTQKMILSQPASF